MYYIMFICTVRAHPEIGSTACTGEERGAGGVEIDRQSLEVWGLHAYIFECVCERERARGNRFVECVDVNK